MGTELTLIPCAGRENIFGRSAVQFHSTALVPVHGKPAISWILDNLYSKKISDPVIICRADDHSLQEFLGWAYGLKKSDMVLIQDSKSLLVTIVQGLLQQIPKVGQSVR